MALNIKLLSPSEENMVGYPYSTNLTFEWDLAGWDSMMVGAGFYIQIATAPDFANIIQQFGAGTLAATLQAPLEPETTYFWRVGMIAVAPGAEPVFDNDTFACFVTTIAAPTIESAIGDNTIAGNAATVTWTPITNTNVTDIKINYSTTPNDAEAAWAETTSDQASKTIDGLTVNQTYYISAEAKGKIEFDYSAALSPYNLTSVETDQAVDIITDNGNAVITAL